MSKFSKWQKYEQEKRRLQNLNLTPAEYEEAIKKLVERLGV
jgi:hypothetical protein